jgi:hypothetical protein
MFSQRKGIKPIKNTIQRDEIDQDLRIGLWNVLTMILWERYVYSYNQPPFNITLIGLVKLIWASFFKLRLDTMPDNFLQIHRKIRLYFFSCRWFEVYDMIEFIVKAVPDEKVSQYLKEELNSVLERELSAYRFIGSTLVEISSKEEVDEIDKAINATTNISAVKKHLESALILFSDRKKPDYRNAIKEAISAVEALSRLILRKESATLGNALDEMERLKIIELHPALRSAFQKIYGYTSSADGIRHALQESESLYSEDARFMIITCSAFINYLLEKTSKAGIDLLKNYNNRNDNIS